MADDTFERLTILERAQLLHDATLRRHGEMLDDQADRMAQHAESIALLRGIAERQDRTLLLLADVSDRLERTMQAIKDMRDRGNGH
jgi:hypothetical protein